MENHSDNNHTDQCDNGDYDCVVFILVMNVHSPAAFGAGALHILEVPLSCPTAVGTLPFKTTLRRHFEYYPYNYFGDTWHVTVLVRDSPYLKGSI